MLRFQTFILTCWQVLLIVVIWMIANIFVHYFHIPVPSNLVGMCLLLILVFAKIIRPNWLRLGATWLLAEMLLFFVPAVMAVVNYPQLVRQHGLQIVSVICLSTLCVIISTSWVVDKMHHIEVKLARRRSLQNAANKRGSRL
ncbi:CidA/LrgA family protein [Celerinatantimonas yamalensis]|uniref:CidA/LrgA family protein n=1 Tax=Celerinatantimonas yamalensis TaxID=559956 RepID=A0ABW9G6Q1_9GAMM